jgi:hypothetical protein
MFGVLFQIMIACIHLGLTGEKLFGVPLLKILPLQSTLCFFL